MANTGEPEVTVQCPACRRWLQHDASIAIGHIQKCAFDKYPYMMTCPVTVNIKIRYYP